MKKYRFFGTNTIVCLGQIIDFNGIKLEINEKIISDNHKLFEIINFPIYFKCIQNSNYNDIVGYFTVGKIYESLENHDFFHNSIKLIDDMGAEKTIFNWTNEFLSNGNTCFEQVTKKEFIENKKNQIIEEAKKLFPVGCRVSNVNIDRGCYFIITGTNFRWSGDDLLISHDSTLDTSTYTVRNSSGIWAEVEKPILKTEDGVDIYEHDHYYTMDYTQGFGVNISFSNDSVLPYVVGRKYFSSRKAANEWVEKNLIKNLSHYENMLFEKNVTIKGIVESSEVVSSRVLFYNIMKHSEPKLYWNRVFQLIADDLNGEWKVKDNCEKWMVGKREINSWKPVAIKHNTVTYCDVYFKSKEFAEKAIQIMGTNINKIYK